MSTNATTVSAPTFPVLSGGLWVAQGLLAALFLAAGAMKSTSPTADLVANGLAWVANTPEALVRFIGVSELLGAVGLILPSATRILPWLTPLAAAALTLVMVLAFGMHAWNGEYTGLPVNVVIGALTAFVAWGRWVKAPIQGRS